jgi:hypothetical protein
VILPGRRGPGAVAPLGGDASAPRARATRSARPPAHALRPRRAISQTWPDRTSRRARPGRHSRAGQPRRGRRSRHGRRPQIEGETATPIIRRNQGRAPASPPARARSPPLRRQP